MLKMIMTKEPILKRNVSRLILTLVGAFLAVMYLMTTNTASAAGLSGECASTGDCSEGECAGNACFCQDPAPSRRGTCQARRSSGAVCLTDENCQSGLACIESPVTGTKNCQSNTRPEGAVCLTDADCQSGLACTEGPGTGTKQCSRPAVEQTPASAKSDTAPTFQSPESFGYRNPLGATSIPIVVGRIVRAAVGLTGALFLAAFIWGGVLWMTAGGDTERVKKARTTITNAVIGLLVVGFAYTILSVMISVAGSL